MTALVQTIAVAEYLSFHRAARALGTSQSSVSARVKALEEELGILLFQRNTPIEAADTIREVIDRIIITPGEKRGSYRITLQGELGTILD